VADISVELAIISTATYGEQVRTALCDALRKINNGSGSSGGFISGDVVSTSLGGVLPIAYGTITEPESGV
jgi:hypothetical protein